MEQLGGQSTFILWPVTSNKCLLARGMRVDVNGRTYSALRIQVQLSVSAVLVCVVVVCVCVCVCVCVYVCDGSFNTNHKVHSQQMTLALLILLCKTGVAADQSMAASGRWNTKNCGELRPHPQKVSCCVVVVVRVRMCLNMLRCECV